MKLVTQFTAFVFGMWLIYSRNWGRTSELGGWEALNIELIPILAVLVCVILLSVTEAKQKGS